MNVIETKFKWFWKELTVSFKMRPTIQFCILQHPTGFYRLYHKYQKCMPFQPSTMFAMMRLLWSRTIIHAEIPLTNRAYSKCEVRRCCTSHTGPWLEQHLLGKNRRCRVACSFCVVHDRLLPADERDWLVCVVCKRNFCLDYNNAEYSTEIWYNITNSQLRAEVLNFLAGHKRVKDNSKICGPQPNKHNCSYKCIFKLRVKQVS